MIREDADSVSELAWSSHIREFPFDISVIFRESNLSVGVHLLKNPPTCFCRPLLKLEEELGCELDVNILKTFTKSKRYQV